MADAENASCQWPQATCKGHLKPFTRNGAQGFHIDTGRDRDRGNRNRSGGFHFAEKAQLALQAPLRNGGLRGLCDTAVALEHIGHALVVYQTKTGFQAHQ